MNKLRPLPLVIFALINVSISLLTLGATLYLFHFSYEERITAGVEQDSAQSLKQSVKLALNLPVDAKDGRAARQVANDLVNEGIVYAMQVKDNEGHELAHAFAPGAAPSPLRDETIPVGGGAASSLPMVGEDFSSAQEQHVQPGQVRIWFSAHKAHEAWSQAYLFHVIAFACVGLLMVGQWMGSAFWLRRRLLAAKKGGADQQVGIRELLDLGGTVRDLSSQLDSSLSALEKANLAKRLLVAHLLRDLYEPLNSMDFLLGQASTLVANEKARTVLEPCIGALQQIMPVLDRLKDCELLDAENYRREDREFNPEVFFDDLRVNYENKTLLEFVVRAEKSDEEALINTCIISDYDKLMRIACNLLDNAFAYTVSGRVHVHWGLRRDKQGVMLFFSVHDSGRGIRSENLPRVFDPCFQEDPRGPGWGLGLSVAQAFVEVLDGTCELASKVDFGTRAEVCVPVRLGAMGVTVSKLPLPQYDLSALVVDDNENNCTLMAEMLGRFGVRCETRTRLNLEAELSEIVLGGYDLIFVDYAMPLLNGLELCHKINSFNAQGRNDSRTVARVVCMTAQDGEQVDADIAQGKMLEWVHFRLKKPLMLADLESILKQAAEIDKPLAFLEALEKKKS